MNTLRLLSTSALAVLLLAGCSSTEPAVDDRDYFDGGALKDPQPMTLVLTGRVLKSQGRLVESEAVLRRTLREHPGYSPAAVELAELLVKDERAGEATLVLERAIISSPDEALLHNDLGMCHLLSGRNREAGAAFERARSLDPSDATYTANLAMTHGILGEYDRAFELYVEVLPRQEAHRNVARLAQARGDDVRADSERALATSTSE